MQIFTKICKGAKKKTLQKKKKRKNRTTFGLEMYKTEKKKEWPLLAPWQLHTNQSETAFYLRHMYLSSYQHFH